MFDDIPDILTAKECQQLLKIGSRWRIYKFSVIEFLRKR